MRARRPLLLGVALGAIAAAASAAVPAGVAARAGAGTGEIVFVSARATADSGEIYAVAGGSRRPVFHSAYAEIGLATSPTGPALAFWSDRSGAWRLMLSPDGRALRTVPIAGAAQLDRPPWPPVFSPDGTRLLIPYLSKDAIAPVPSLALAVVKTGAAADLARLCGLPPSFAPDGRGFACATPDQAKVQVMDASGHVVATPPGKVALWSADGRLAVPSGARTAVLSERGRVLTRIAGVARAWSPDGRLLALTRPQGLVLAQPGRSAPVRLVAPGGAAPTWVSFTPDGREIAYASAAGVARIAAVAGGAAGRFSAPPGGVWSRDGRYAVAVASAHAVRVVLRDRLGRVRPASGSLPHDDGGESVVAWSGDDRRLLYDTSTAGSPELWSMHADGSAQTRLTASYHAIAQPAWNAAGTRLAYASSGGFANGSIVIAAAGGARLALLPGVTPGEPSPDGSPSWSPDGRRIAVADATAGGATVLGVGGGRTDLAVDGVAPAWSPDGREIAFVDLDDGTVWGSAPSGADRHRLLPASIHGVRALAWSPDGRRLAFSTDNGIYSARPDARDPGTTIVRAVLPSRPSFSPDGRRIVYSGVTAGLHPYRAIFVAGSDGSARRQLTQGPFDSGDPTWRPAKG